MNEPVQDSWSKGCLRVQLILRLVTLVMLVALLTVHIKSLRVFRWEQSVSGGVLVTYSISMLGLAMSGDVSCKGPKALQAYICATGVVLLALNSGMIFRKWKEAGELTRVVAELLGVLGVPIKRYILIKGTVSALVSAAFLADFSISLVAMHYNAKK